MAIVISRARGHEVLDRVKRLNAAPGADCLAIQGGGSTGEIELPLERPILKKSVDKSGVEDISCPGGIHDRNTISRGEVKLLAIPCEYAFFSQSCSGEEGTVTPKHKAKCILKVAFTRDLRRKIPAYDEIVDIFKQIFHARIYLIQIGDYADASSASPASSQSCCGRIVTINVKSTGIHDPFAIEVAGLKNKPFIPSAKDGSLALAVDEYQ
jgi:hypothetical protein